MRGLGYSGLEMKTDCAHSETPMQQRWFSFVPPGIGSVSLVAATTRRGRSTQLIGVGGESDGPGIETDRTRIEPSGIGFLSYIEIPLSLTLVVALALALTLALVLAL